MTQIEENTSGRRELVSDYGTPPFHYRAPSLRM